MSIDFYHFVFFYNVSSSCRCGDGVMQLYQSSEVEDFLTGTPSTCDKAIYCHGALRKVITVFF